jgi:hypothetical protein
VRSETDDDEDERVCVCVRQCVYGDFSAQVEDMSATETLARSLSHTPMRD